jgi:hypothetical protein
MGLNFYLLLRFAYVGSLFFSTHLTILTTHHTHTSIFLFCMAFSTHSSMSFISGPLSPELSLYTSLYLFLFLLAWTLYHHVLSEDFWLDLAHPSTI